MRNLLLSVLLLFNVSLAHAQNNVALLLFGGEGHKTFLGCLNCGKYNSGSICNKYGDQGSKYNSDSIWNKYGNYGSKYSNQSPWNKYASEPPAIVDKEGNFYGYLTANSYNQKRTRIKLYVQLTDLWEEITDDPEPVADRLCGRE
ncbi:MAG: hypothetical protein A3F76_08370 [Burkholderiales bacterium RIFCSPLOWO2_12_FULL_65_40]|nr:MAG: hypothetical protein A3F76_08370 [Burkholderiales bacterium RIFCSPLOWO2_12_FULL_65_40]